MTGPGRPCSGSAWYGWDHAASAGSNYMNGFDDLATHRTECSSFIDTRSYGA